MPSGRLRSGGRLMIFGDSWTAGWEAEPRSAGFAYLIGEMLDVATEVDGEAATGYLNPGTRIIHGDPVRRTFLDRLIARPRGGPTPDLVVVQGSVNDQRHVGRGIRSAAQQVIHRLSADAPGATIVLMGPAPARPAMVGTLHPVDWALTLACRQQKVPYISPLRERWLRTADLQRYMDPGDAAPHPNTACHAYLAERLTTSLRQLGATE